MILPTFLRRLRARLKHRHFGRDLFEEIAAHRTMAEQAARASGAGQEEAGSRASRQLGNTALAREDARAVWIPVVLQQAVQDGRYALRGMRRAPGFTLAAVSMLTIGLGLVAGGYTVVNGLFMRGWAVPDSRQVFRAFAERAPSTSGGYVNDGFSYGAFEFISSNSRSGSYVSYAIDYYRIAVTADGAQQYSAGLSVSDNFIDVMRIPLQRGAAFSSPATSGVPRIVVSDRIWRRVFEGDQEIVGRTVYLNRQPAIVVGVIAEGFEGLGERFVDIFAEIRSGSSRYAPILSGDAACCVSLAGRIRAGWTREQAREELELLTARYRQSIRQPMLTVELAGTEPGAALRHRGGEFLLALGLTGAGALLVLLLTCANVGNLYLARCLRRQREVAIRLSLGASRTRLVRQLLTEGLVLAAIAGTGAFFVTAGVPPLMNLIDDGQPMSMFAPDWRVAAFTMACVVLTCLVVSLTPALQTTRIAWRGAAATMSVRTGRMRGMVLAVQIAVALVLVLGATLVGRGIQHSLSVPADFALGTTRAIEIEAPADGDYDRDDATRIRGGIGRAAAQVGLRVGLADRVPASRRAAYASSVQEPSSEVRFRTSLIPLSQSAFEVLELRLVIGRLASDDPASDEAVVNETLARRIWPDGDPLGRTLVLHFNSRTYTVVGVARDAHLTGLDEVDPILHIPSSLGLPVLLVRNESEMEGRVKALVASIDPALTLRSRPLSESVKETLEGAMIGASIAGGLGALALLLAVVGIFGVFSYLVEERRREIGIRLALGATRTHIGGALFHATKWPVAGGLIAGFLVSACVSVGLREFLFGLSAADPISYLSVTAVLGVSAIVATAIPIRRAVRVDPAAALKAD